MNESASPPGDCNTSSDDRIRCSVVVVSYNSRSDLSTCLSSLVSQTLYQQGGLEIIVVDNASSDDSIAVVREQFPGVAYVQLTENLGYAGGNNMGFRQAQGEYLGVINPDCVADPTCFAQLVRTLESDRTIGMATPKVLLLDSPGIIDTCGLGIDASGYGAGRGHGEPATSFARTERVASVCGSCFVARRETIEELGGFDEAFFLYVEEVDLSMRARLLGFDILFEPSATVRHNHNLTATSSKFYYLERNRYQVLYKSLSTRSLLCLAPGLVLNELGVWAYAATRGRSYLRAKARANLWLFTQRRNLRHRRRQVQATRRVPDRDILRVISSRMPLAKLKENRLAQLGDSAIHQVNRFCLRCASIASQNHKPGLCP